MWTTTARGTCASHTATSIAMHGVLMMTFISRTVYSLEYTSRNSFLRGWCGVRVGRAVRMKSVWNSYYIERYTTRLVQQLTRTYTLTQTHRPSSRRTFYVMTHQLRWLCISHLTPLLPRSSTSSDRARINGVRLACAIRLARSAASCNQGTPGHSKIAQRRRGGWLRPGRRDPGGRRRLGQCVKTTTTRRCAVRASFGTALKQG